MLKKATERIMKIKGIKMRNEEKKLDPEIHDLFKTLQKDKLYFEIENVFLISTTVVENTKDVNKLKQWIQKFDLSSLELSEKRDVKKDMVKCFLILLKNGEYVLVGLLDPYELYFSLQIIAISQRVAKVEDRFIENKLF